MKKISLLILLFFINTLVFATETNGIDMADKLVENGKIYVVVTVLSTIFAGIVVYLVSIDRKIGKLEKEIKS